MQWPENASKLSREEIYDRLKGCIFGAAIGDAVGLATEFMTKQMARQIYGIGPIAFGNDKGYEFYVDRHRDGWDFGEWTDDTDQQLLIIDTLISNDGVFNTRDFSARLANWSNQGYPELDNKPPNGIGMTVGSVIRHSKFSKQPHRSAWEVWVRFDCNMAANGALMRTAVLGVPFFWDEKQVIKQTLQATKVTHADPRCCVSSVIVTMLISKLIKGDIQNTSSDLDEETREEILKWMQSGNPKNGVGQDLDEEISSPEDKNNTKRRSFIGKVINKVKNNLNNSSSNLFELWAKRAKRPYDSKQRNIAVIPDPPPPGVETFGSDPIMLELTRSLVERYKFMILRNSKEQDDSTKIFKTFESDTSEKMLINYCFPNSFAELGLDERSSIGYVYKCLGAALYSFTRNLNGQENEGQAFKKIITELTLEAGDADTNATVAGALLGARIGYSKLPKEWVDGLKYKDWLNKRVDCLWDVISKASD
ncbi:2618_t:CDS:2 [Acaulospora morrowiae]|uniref:2618_t:CDS:1 n=1 Tax=Acaulospora morrowiae TaxID=94023 RepID=A0A9N9DA08_9GLOM|nr:2618_t:CDS:2 [Acaulospora morrowiae]